MYDSDNAALTGFLAGRADNGNSCCNGNGGFGFGGGWDGLWGIIILAMIFGWNNGNWGGFGGGNNGAANFIPYAVGNSYTDSALQRGFDTQTIIGKLDGINSGICSLGYDQLAQMNSISAQVANGFAGVGNAICNLGYEQAQLNNATNVAIMQGNNALSTQLAQCLKKISKKAKEIFCTDKFYAVGTCAA